MPYQTIKTDKQHLQAMVRLFELGSLESMTEAQSDEFEIIASLVENYKGKHFRMDTSDVTHEAKTINALSR